MFYHFAYNPGRANVGCPTTAGYLATIEYSATSGYLAILGCPTTMECPYTVGFCSLANCFKYLLASVSSLFYILGSLLVPLTGYLFQFTGL
jgi:hypothetical protein